ncbi:LysR family transcriptional regulator [Stagnihabitans tardus]|uniref:LysR family transcriptional regulator n=1 Tax=Stagnihabitans tardus TaxID=2699202 RepID=A0AAE4YBV9_9RHOB|nr:LysR family transcriptional regulator [Stagnihabitans tardus]NBZ86820.1 LysR family transcriptional regulator [Stagnihabitans tardus]
MIDWRSFPSLTALRAFEAAARLQSFTLAARELNVTHAAVAQQVRGLEDHLGRELLYREGRGMALTPEGAKLAAALVEGFRGIGQALAEVKGGGPGAALRVTLTAAFAANWLMPKLGGFWKSHPDIELSLNPEKRVVDLRREGIDLGIRFGNGKWPGLDVEFLTAADYVIVAAPELLAGRVDLSNAEMSDMPWIMAEDWPETQTWLKGFGLKPDAMNITDVPTEDLALSAARAGLGLYVEAEALVEHDVENGTLQIVGRLKDDSLAYYMVTRPGPKRPELKAFIRWLKAAV